MSYRKQSLLTTTSYFLHSFLNLASYWTYRKHSFMTKQLVLNKPFRNLNLRSKTKTTITKQVGRSPRDFLAKRRLTVEYDLNSLNLGLNASLKASDRAYWSEVVRTATLLEVCQWINEWISVLLIVGRNVRWPRRMLTPGESRWVCWRDKQTDRQKDGRTDARPLHYAFRWTRKSCSYYRFSTSN